MAFLTNSEWDQHYLYRIGTTADAISHSSGGPALTEVGEFFGIVHAISVNGESLEEQGFAFDGDEDPDNWHSNLVNCWAVHNFLKDLQL